MICKFHLFWISVVSILFSFSCKQGNNPYRSNSNMQQMESYGNMSGDNNFLSSGKKVPVLRKLNLQTLMVGKNRIEVEELMGPPEGKSLDGGNGYLWDYRRPVYDEASDKIYGWSLISFKFLSGRCSTVNVRLEVPPVQLSNPQPSTFIKQNVEDYSEENEASTLNE